MAVQMDRFVQDRLPAAGNLPLMRYDLPELLRNVEATVTERRGG